MIIIIIIIIIIFVFYHKYHLDLDFIFLGWATFLLGRLFLNLSYHIIVLRPYGFIYLLVNKATALQDALCAPWVPLAS
jgi:uncharacterized membrane protein YhfC